MLPVSHVPWLCPPPASTTTAVALSGAGKPPFPGERQFLPLHAEAGGAARGHRPTNCAPFPWQRHELGVVPYAWSNRGREEGLRTLLLILDKT